MEKVKVAVVGLGRIASLLEDDALREKPCTHAGAFSTNPDCVLVAGSDKNPDRQSLFAKRWKVPVYANTETMLKEHEPQILVIAVQPDNHAEYCELAAKYGTAVAVCEKPLADTLEAAECIAKLHQSRKITILTNHERRYAADYNEAKRLLDEGRLGGILSVRAVIYMGKERKLRNVLWDDATHLADIAMFLSGALLVHKASLGAKLTGKVGTAFFFGSLEKMKTGLKKESEIPFVMELGAGRDHLVFEIEVSCDSGRLRIGNGIFEVWESRLSPYAEGFMSLEKIVDGFEGKTGYFVNMAKDAVACVRERTREPVSSALDGVQVIRYLNSLN